MKATRALLLALLAVVNQAEPATAIQILTFKHLLAILARQAPNPECVIKISGLKPDAIMALLNKHNELRSSIATGKAAKFPHAADMNMLEWDDGLTSKAHITAAYCDPTREGKAEDLKPTAGDSGGEIAQNTGSAPVKAPDQGSKGATAILENWIKPKENFEMKLVDNYADPTDQEAKRFAQLIWAKTVRVGCSFVQYTLKAKPSDVVDLFVCDYAPGGRQKGQPIYKKGAACSMCAEGTKCDDATKLCKKSDSDDTSKEKHTEKGGSGLAVVGIIAAVIAVVVALVGVYCMRRSGKAAAGAAPAEGAAPASGEGGAGDEAAVHADGSKESPKSDDAAAAEGAKDKADKADKAK